MSPAEIQALLMAAKALDDRVMPDQARVAGWLGVIKPDLPFDFARDVLMRHYAESTDVIMPAHFNIAWSIERRARDRIAETNRRLAELEDNRDQEMSPETRAALDEFWRKRGGRPGEKRTDAEAGEDDAGDDEDGPA